MNITFNLEINASKDLDSTLTIFIRCTQNRNHRRISTGVSVLSSQWDKARQKVKNNHPTAKELNELIQQKLSKVISAYSGLLSEFDTVELNDLIVKIADKPITNFFDFAYSHKMEEIRISNKMGTFRKYDAILKKLRQFAGNNLKITSINYSFIQKYILFLKTEFNNGQDTITSNLSLIRTIINDAIKHGLYKVANPCNQLKLKYTDNSKEKLTAAEMSRLINSRLPKSRSVNIARDFFLACFLAEGTRAGDMILMKKEQIIDGCLVFNQQKTGKSMIITISPQLQEIFSRYDEDGKYIFPFLNDEPKVTEVVVGNKLAYINKYLKEVAKYCGIFKKLSTHVARHTFTDLALQVTNGNIYQVSQSLGHSSVKTTEIYSKNRVNAEKKSIILEILKEIN